MCPKEDSAQMNGLPARNSPEWDNQENEEQEEEEVEYLDGSGNGLSFKKIHKFDKMKITKSVHKNRNSALHRFPQRFRRPQ